MHVYDYILQLKKKKKLPKAFYQANSKAQFANYSIVTKNINNKL